MVAALLLPFVLQIAQAIAVVLSLLVIVCFVYGRTSSYGSDDAPNVTVLVLGDIGRSPRMQYHSLSLAKHGCNVSLVGYPGAQPMDDIKTNPRIRLAHIEPLAVPAKLPFTVRAVLKVVSLLWQLFVLLMFKVPRPHAVLVQNPPAIPSLLLARLSTWAQGASLIVDFHNFGYSLLELKLGSRHPVVKAHYAYEQVFGRLADNGFCVTEQMKRWLADTWSVKAVPLHDKPNAMFKPTELEAQHELFSRLHSEGAFKAFDDWWPADDANGSRGLFTEGNSKGSTAGIRRAEKRPRLIISSTSWTPDEDFGQLLDAIPALDAKLHSAGIRAVILVTGKGDLKKAFEVRAAKLRPELKAVRLSTLWLSFADYAGLLGSADLGLSLHTSSSGIDLPMKVVDMFGAGLPVCAKNFPALPELVVHGENGLVFDSTEELSDSLAHALGVHSPKLPPLKAVAGVRKLSGWDENWDSVAWPVIQSELRLHGAGRNVTKKED
eukprot:TRINITY_DN14955_c1_g1_i1.p1 TRINITY_DN14955_c1_g1~~TRINITY_DN14955_c1_g1_i1.p1  ORF type:complete len:492 (-),score=77.91 TRINITY_DN14955_c1_g1_i1:66-1541(-)